MTKQQITTAAERRWFVEFGYRSDGGPRHVGPFDSREAAEQWLDEQTTAIRTYSASAVPMEVPTPTGDVPAARDQAATDDEREALAEAERRWPSYPTVGFSGADDRQRAFIEGVRWLAARRQPTPTVTAEQVEAGARAVTPYFDDVTPTQREVAIETARRTLAAALDVQP